MRNGETACAWRPTSTVLALLDDRTILNFQQRPDSGARKSSRSISLHPPPPPLSYDTFVTDAKHRGKVCSCGELGGEFAKDVLLTNMLHLCIHRLNRHRASTSRHGAMWASRPQRRPVKGKGRLHRLTFATAFRCLALRIALLLCALDLLPVCRATCPFGKVLSGDSSGCVWNCSEPGHFLDLRVRQCSPCVPGTFDPLG